MLLTLLMLLGFSVGYLPSLEDGMNLNTFASSGVESRNTRRDATAHDGGESGGELRPWLLHSKSPSASVGVAANLLAKIFGRVANGSEALELSTIEKGESLQSGGNPDAPTTFSEPLYDSLTILSAEKKGKL